MANVVTTLLLLIIIAGMAVGIYLLVKGGGLSKKSVTIAGMKVDYDSGVYQAFVDKDPGGKQEDQTAILGVASASDIQSKCIDPCTKPPPGTTCYGVNLVTPQGSKVTNCYIKNKNKVQPPNYTNPPDGKGTTFLKKISP